MGVKHVALVVAVVFGGVQVEFMGKTYTLVGGQERVFAEEGGGHGHGEIRPVKPPTKPGEGHSTQPKGTAFSGEITKTEESALTVTVHKGDKGEKSVVVKIVETSKISLQTDEFETVQTSAGEKKRRKLAEGKLADLKVGQRVYGSATEGGDVIQLLVIKPQEKPKTGTGTGHHETKPTTHIRSGEHN